MTEGPQHEKPMCVRVWLEVGHACSPRRALGHALALDWRVWVRGMDGADISAFVHKVVFHLRPPSAFVYPKRVIQEPPYEIQESGCASIEIPIHVYLKHSVKPKRIRLRYRLQVENSAKSSSATRCVYYDVENPSEALWQALVKGGGEVVARADNSRDKLVVLLSESPAMKDYKFVEPIDSAPKKSKTTNNNNNKTDDVCAKCGESTNGDFRKQLKAIAMTDDEIKRVSQLYTALSGYEKSTDALMLPALTDPIYSVPELPQSLKAALTSVEADYAMQ